MANEKYADAKCFVFSPDGYLEITYAELCRRREEDTTYRTKKFLPLHGMLMEVTLEEYRAFYKACRQKYLTERSVENGDISIDMLTTDAFNGADILPNDADSVVDRVIRSMMMDKLKQAMLLLPDEEQLLICQHYHSNISETKLAVLYGISQQAISKRIGKIQDKLKKLLEN